MDFPLYKQNRQWYNMVMEWIKVHKDKTCWHFWFAWHPVVVQEYPDDSERKRWLVWVVRKGREYRYYSDHGPMLSWEYQYKDKVKV